jgi:hypothetical protein
MLNQNGLFIPAKAVGYGYDKEDENLSEALQTLKRCGVNLCGS